MKLIIDISEYDQEWIRNTYGIPQDIDVTIARAIMNGETYEPERKKGKWIDMGDFEQCSVCTATRLKEVQTVYGKALWIKTNFCPNCGADMRGEKE